MPLVDPASIVVLSKLGAGWELLNEDLQAPAEGWDVLTLTYARDYGATTKTADEVSAEWPIGRRPFAGRDFWVVARVPKLLAGNVWTIVLTCHGASGQKPVKVNIRSTSEVQSIPGPTNVGPPLYPLFGTISKGDLLEAQPSLAVSYVLIGQAPPTDRVGRAGEGYQTPPAVVAVRPSIWTYLASPTFHLPYGWVMNDLDADVLAGTDEPVSLVTEGWIYRHLRTP